MLSRHLIINGRKLNFMQKMLFERSNIFIMTLLTIAMFMIMMFELTLVGYFEEGTKQTLAMLSIAITVLTGPIIIQEVIFKSSRMWVAGIDEKEKMLSTSWIISKKMLNDVVEDPMHSEMQEVLSILQKSYGHKIIEQRKKDMYFYSDSMINFMEEPTLELVGNKLTTYNEKDRKKPFFNPFTFNNLTEKEVKEIYAYVKGIDQNDIFARKALETSKKKDLVKILDTELVEKYNG